MARSDLLFSNEVGCHGAVFAGSRSGQLAEPSEYQVGLKSFDQNDNGRDEIYWTTEYHPTLVHEERPRKSPGPRSLERS